MKWIHGFLFSLICASSFAETTSSIDEYFRELALINQFNGVLLVKDADGVILYKAYHGVDLPKWGQIEERSLFHIASVRKLFTQYLVYQGSNNSQLATRPIVQWVKMHGLNPKWTLEMLLQHQSGLPRGEQFDFDQIRYDEAQLKQLIVRQQLLHEPGAEYHYSNFGYLMADIALAELYKKPAIEVYRDKVYQPLGMSATLNAKEAKSHPLRAKGIYQKEEKWIEAEFSEFERFPSGDVFSTASDMMKFLEQIDPAAFSKDGVIEHAGAKRGYRSFVYRNQTGKSVVMLSNLASVPITQVIQDLKQMLAGNRVSIPRLVQRKSIAFQTDIAMQLIGEYRLKVNGQVFKLTCDKEGLILVDISKPGSPKSNSPKPERLFFESRDILYSDPTAMDYLKIKWEGNIAVSFSIFAMGGAEFATERLSIEEGVSCE
ncbi:MAG: beta-lactamase family protein [Gammaproteobacteria bacterium]|nr:beta-lactamase family protein [Gammaproteobacteria bacterium]